MAKKIIKGLFASKTDIGRVRVTNEDQALSLINASGDVLLAVCDGMGGHNKGDYASRIAKETITEEFRRKSGFLTKYGPRIWLTKTIKMVNKRIYDESQSNSEYKDMGTTVVIALFHQDLIYILNIGDSRAYSVGFSGMKQLTSDQSYVEYLYKTGKITADERNTNKNRHVLMNAVGPFPSVSFDLFIIQNIKNPILLCSDGIYNNVTEKEMHSILNTNERIEQKISSLISVGNSNGGTDNMAISYWEALEND